MFKPIVNDLMAHAKRRVPELAAEHGRPATREGGAPPRRPSAKAAADGRRTGDDAGPKSETPGGSDGRP